MCHFIQLLRLWVTLQAFFYVKHRANFEFAPAFARY
jgi:hypothetical protein